ncbi:MAG: MBL fold metallo-hydrolase [Bryobacteraceae bacterium]
MFRSIFHHGAQRRLGMAAGFAALLAAGAFVTLTEAQPGTFKPIMPGIWFREGDLKQYGHCNNIVIEMKDYLIVIDANFPSGAKALINDVKKVSKKPVKYVFDTHHHGDHAYGNAVWTGIGATTLAYAGVAEEMKRYEPKRWQEAAKERKDVAELNRPTAEPPKETFSKIPYVLDDGVRRVEFHFFGWAHTRGDGFAYLPREKVLCTGDAVTNGPYNYMGDGHVKNWPSVVDRALKLDARTILPGHGIPGGREVLTGERQFMVEIYKAVQGEIRKGRKLEDLVKLEKGQAKSTSLKLPDSVKNWVGDFLPGQVQSTYEEIAQGKPHGEILGGK